jgi:hypothetical protein
LAIRAIKAAPDIAGATGAVVAMGDNFASNSAGGR